MPKIKLQNHQNDDSNIKKDLMSATNKKSLVISKTKYSRILRKDCKHSNYLNGFKTLRKHSDNDSPTFNDFITNPNHFYFDLPYPIVKPYISDKEYDECIEIFNEKLKYRNKLKNYAYYFKSDKKWLTKKYVERTKYTKLPRYLIDLAVGNVKDPDEQFEGIYNWFYSGGGILSKFYTNNEEYLINPLPNNDLRLVNVNDYQYKEERIKIPNLEDDPILNLTVKKNFLILRQRNFINLFNLFGNENFSLLHLYKTSSKIKNPFLDVKLFNFDLSVLDYSRKLSLVNLNDNSTKNFKFEPNEDNLSDPYCQLEPIDENTLGFIDRNTLRFLDVRTFNEQVFKMNDKLFLCDDLCCVNNLSNSPYLFLSTVHNIKKFDVRMNKIVKSWCHMLSGQPSMVKIEKTLLGNIIFISSQKYNERVVLNSNEEESNIVQLVPNNYETFKKSNLIDFDTNYQTYEDRLKYSTIGIEVIENKKTISLYTCNCLGDIFQTNLGTSKSYSDFNLVEFTNWRKYFQRKINPVSVTHLKDMSNAKFILKKPIREDALKIYTKPNKKRSEYIAENTIEGSAFANIWIGDENVHQESLAPVLSADSKVSDWLEGVINEQSDDEL